MDLKSCHLFKGLTVKQLNRILSTAKEISMARDQRIFTGGEAALGFHILKTGAVELMLKSENDLEIPVAILRDAGNCFGISALLPNRSYSLSARCVRDGTFLFAESSLLQKIISEESDLGRILMTNTADFFLERLMHARQELRIHFTNLFKSVYF